MLCPLRRFFDLVLKLFWQCGIFCFYFIILLESRTLSRCISEKRSNRHTRHFVLKWLFRCRERESLCICMLRVSFLPLSMMFRLYNGTVSTVWNFLCFIYFYFFFGGGDLLKNCSQTFYIVFLLVNSSASVFDNQQSFVILVSRWQTRFLNKGSTCYTFSEYVLGIVNMLNHYSWLHNVQSVHRSI